MVQSLQASTPQALKENPEMTPRFVKSLAVIAVVSVVGWFAMPMVARLVVALRGALS
jgi:hypothetical protein